MNLLSDDLLSFFSKSKGFRKALSCPFFEQSHSDFEYQCSQSPQRIQRHFYLNHKLLVAYFLASPCPANLSSQLSFRQSQNQASWLQSSLDAALPKGWEWEHHPAEARLRRSLADTKRPPASPRQLCHPATWRDSLTPCSIGVCQPRPNAFFSRLVQQEQPNSF